MNAATRPGALAAGFAAWRTARLPFLLLLLSTVVLSILAAAPVGPSLSEAFGGTLAGDHVVKDHPTFAPTDVFDFWREKAAALAGARAAERWTALVVLFQQIFFAGGLVVLLGRSPRITPPEFVAAARSNFWHNVKCFLIFLGAALVGVLGWLLLTRAISRKAFEGSAPGSWPPFLFRILVLVGAILIYAFLSLLHDFARAARRTEPAIGAWRAYAHARRTLSGRWPKAFGLFVFWLLLGGVLLFAGILIEWTAPAVSALAILVHILLQLAVLSIRPAIRVAAWGSYLALYDSALPRPPVSMLSSPSAPFEPAPLPPPILGAQAL